MAIAKVGAFGALSAVSTTSVTPAFGQATTAGNLLVAVIGWVSSSSLTNISTTSTGWTIVAGTGASTFGTALAYKPNCGASETAPTFTLSQTPTTFWCCLTEWSGASSTPLDRSGTNASSNIVSNSTGDTDASDLAVACFSWNFSKSATSTFSDSWTPVGGTSGSIVNSGATKASSAFAASFYLVSGHGGGAFGDSDTQTATPSTGTAGGQTASIASFLPASAVASAPQYPLVIPQAVQRASIW